MPASKFRLILIVVVLLTISTCIDPYYTVLKEYGSMLVVDGLITDSDNSYSVKLTRSFQNQKSYRPEVPYANVFVTDDAGNKAYFYYSGDGVYKSDSSQFRGITGRSYVLHIITPEALEYESDPCLMQPVPDIDSVYYGKDQELFNNGAEIQDELRIYLDSKNGSQGQSYRWAFEETWKFRVPYPKRYDYVIPQTITRVAVVKEYCWKSRKSDAVLVHSVNDVGYAPVEKQPIYFIATGKSDRLMLEYSILVKQYSISKREYDFWSNLKTVDESGGDIFGSQPYPVVSNIHCVNYPNERVLGYFQVSAVKQKRIFIPFSAVIDLQLPFYNEDKCSRIEAGPEGFGGSFDNVYSDYCITSTYTFVEPEFSAAGLDRLVFTTPECANCELSGTSSKPDFWIDLN